MTEEKVIWIFKNYLEDNIRGHVTIRYFLEKRNSYYP